MLIWAFLLLAVPLGKIPFHYPPSGVILVQRSYRVPLRWDLPGQEFRLKVERTGKTYLDKRLKAKEFSLDLENGGPYTWSVESLDGSGRLDSEFTLSRSFDFHRDARDGVPGRAGSNGPNIEVELSKDQLGVHVKLICSREHYHFLLADTSLPFLISARGGNGGNGLDGRFDPEKQILTAGKDGGDAGWGGIGSNPHARLTLAQVSFVRCLCWGAWTGWKCSPGQQSHLGKRLWQARSPWPARPNCD